MAPAPTRKLDTGETSDRALDLNRAADIVLLCYWISKWPHFRGFVKLQVVVDGGDVRCEKNLWEVLKKKNNT